MRRTLPPLPPLWFSLPVTVALALGARLAVHASGAPAAAPHLELAFWGFLLSLLGYLWDGSKVAIQAVVQALQWSVKALWAFATATYNGLVKVGRLLGDGMQAVWKGLRALYEDVLKPAWQKFWKLFDRFRTWLHDTFAPVLKFLYRVRDELEKFYKHWIKPVLTVLDATRAILRVLETLHVKWAQQLDATLADLEAKIEAPFTYVLGKLNDVINAVNRIATADGLFQRIALLRSLERDAEYWIRTWWLWQVGPDGAPAPLDADALDVPRLDPAELADALALYYTTGGGEMAETIDASAAYLPAALGLVPFDPSAA